jgi:hypothetical protein
VFLTRTFQAMALALFASPPAWLSLMYMAPSAPSVKAPPPVVFSPGWHVTVAERALLAGTGTLARLRSAT